MSKKKVYTANIKGHDWSFYSQTRAAYIRKHGLDSEGITYPSEYEVYFMDSTLTPAIARHELMHCYVAGSNTNSAYLDSNQVEELCASIFEEHGPEMDFLADKIVTFFKEKK